MLACVRYLRTRDRYALTSRRPARAFLRYLLGSFCQTLVTSAGCQGLIAVHHHHIDGEVHDRVLEFFQCRTWRFALCRHRQEDLTLLLAKFLESAFETLG